MLTAYQIDALRDKSSQLLDPIIDFLIEDIAKRVSEAGQLTGTASYQIWRAQNLGISQRKIKKELRKRLKVSHRELRRLLTQAAETGYNFDINRFPQVQAVPFSKNTSIQQIVDTAVKMAQEDLLNITQTIGFICPDGEARTLTKAYQSACDFAFTKVATGAQDFHSALRDATRGLAEKGILSIDYESGVHTSLEAAVRRNIMGGLGLMQERISQQNHDDLGCDGWEISAHSGSAPDHEPIQGKQYPDKVYKRLNDSLKRRIGTLNCGHAASPIIMGVNEPQYTPEELEHFRQENEEGVTVDGKHYTKYEATQRQRGLERAARKQKRKILIDEAAGDTEKLQQDQIKLVRIRQEYKRFSDAAGLRMQHERMNTAGFTWKHGKAAEKTSTQYENDFTLRANSGTMKAISGARITNVNGSAAEKHAERYYGLVRSMTNDVARIAQNTGYSEDVIQRIKNFIFLDEHDLGDPEPRRFDPSFAMAQSWQRLINGTPEPHDLVMLQHEIFEKELMDSGMTQYAAHIEASKKYNYAKESDDYYAALKERKNRK